MDTFLDDESLEDLDNISNFNASIPILDDNVIINTSNKSKAQKRQRNESSIKWTPELIEELLKAREQYQPLFLDAKNKVKLTQGWSKILLDLQLKHGISANVMQLKNKYQNLQSTFRKLHQKDSQTGNFPSISKPVIWDTLVNHFGGSQGLAHDCLNSNQVLINKLNFSKDQNTNISLSDSDIEDTLVPIRKSRRIGIMLDRNSAIKNLGLDIKEGLISLGNNISSNNSSTTNNKVEKLLILNSQFLQENRNQTDQLLKLSSATFELLNNVLKK